jgi:hypothetical protein
VGISNDEDVLTGIATGEIASLAVTCIAIFIALSWKRGLATEPSGNKSNQAGGKEDAIQLLSTRAFSNLLKKGLWGGRRERDMESGEAQPSNSDSKDGN